jgi:hypothetical protein
MKHARRTDNVWISQEDFEGLEPGDMLKTRFMGTCKVIKILPEINEVLVLFIHSAWEGRELSLIKNQILKTI